jgi:sugar phosphate isomerase/epimerase/plastocyanin
MLESLGFRKFVYDYRKEHIPSWDEELAALKAHRVELTGWWFPGSLNEEAKAALELFRRHGVKPQLWITGGGIRPKTGLEHEQRIAQEVARIRPIAEAAAAQGLQVGLYNHGGWFGEPETQVEIIKALDLPNVGIVYNLHHGHEHVRRLRQILELTLPYLICFNLNGMMEDGERRGMKIMPLGQGEQDLEILRIVAASGYRGPIGILNHDGAADAGVRLQDNLDGLRWLEKTLRGEDPGPRPVPKSWVRPTEKAKGAGPIPRFNAGEKPEFRIRPFTIECRAKLNSKMSFQILAARDVKASADHWELYTMAGSGKLAFYQPGRGGNSVADRDIADGQWHTVKAVVEEARVQLFVDGQSVGDFPAKPLTGKAIPGPLVFGGLVEGTIGWDGEIEKVTLEPGGFTWNVGTASVTPAAKPTSFFYQFDPLRPELWPQRTAKVNHYRLYDFYTKQALAFRGRKDVTMTVAYPGLEGGLFGHWGIADDEIWRDARWANADRTPVQAGILKTPKGTFPKAVVLQIGPKGQEKTTFFDPQTLSFPLVSEGRFVTMSDSRHGMMSDLRFPAAVAPGSDAPAAAGTFQYLGYYRHGREVTFLYKRDGKEWLDRVTVEDGTMRRSTVARTGTEAPTGAAQWPEWIAAPGTLGTERPYAIDALPLPPHPGGHPWFVSGHDFLPDGRAAVCTMTGDVWLVRGIDDTLDHVAWKRYASGLAQPLGLKVVGGQVCVQGRDQITRLHDLTGDDEADFYECVTNAQKTSPSGHDYITGCEFDGTYFYFASGNEGICRVKPGEPVEVLATGFRNPNGLGLAKDGAVTSTAQEGDWTPASMIAQITKGGFYGAGGPKPGQQVLQPMLYLPRGVDNSCGGQCFTETDRWGPLGGQLIHFSPGAANHFLILRQTVGQTVQGAAVWLPGDFLSGAQQGRINPKDGQLYVSGMYGWGCWGKDDGCFQRVRYTGGPAHLPVSFALHENGVLVRFSDPLGAVAADASQHFAQCWNYRYGRAYGSPELSVTHPDVEGHDVLGIAAAHALEDGKAVFLEIPLLTPCHQVHLHVSTVEGRYQDLYATAHVLAPPFTSFPGYQAAPKRYLEAGRSQTEVVAKVNPWTKGESGRSLEVTAALGLRFAQTELRAKPGERLTVRFQNPDAVPHNWVLVKPGALTTVGDAANRLIAAADAVARHYVPDTPDVLAYTDMADPGKEFVIHFNAPQEPGRYPYLCTFPGHWAVMNGVMIVEN